MRRMCFSLRSTLPNLKLFGLDFFHACRLPQAKWFLGKLQQSGLVASQHEARGKTRFAPVTDYTYEKSLFGGSCNGSTHWKRNTAFVQSKPGFLLPLCDFVQISHVISFPETSVCAGSGENF